MRTINYILLTAIALSFSSCMQQLKEKKEAAGTIPQKAYEYMTTARLTVSESKRLIAKGIAANKDVKDRLENGIVIITLGTTNTYLAEELAGLSAPRGSFVTGRIFPSSKEDFARGMKRQSEIVLMKGKPADISYADALARMNAKDIVFKGANMVNYAKRQAAVCVGAPDGGTVAKLRKYTDEGKGRWIVPVGLEKETTQDLFEIQKITNGDIQRGKGTVRLNVTQGNIYTEIEAMKEFADVDVHVTAKGGVDGAEGGVSLLICGTKAEVEKAENIVKQLQGEPAFIESVSDSKN
ncbi:hypothetical protein ACNOHN_08080 [Bacteroides zhangwenhongii]|uniref:hypothetical protein n=1 Tax=Bacteroides zhangwenhongii TaxID=2650157 RepID=UPI003AABC7B0